MSDSPPDSIKLLLDGPEPGTRFGNYRLMSMLGRGGFATVFKAELMGEYGFTKQVALKVLRRRVDSLDEREVTGFLNEARLGAHLSHANLVEFYECGRVDDVLYIAMELVQGPNLSQVIRMIPDHMDALEPDAVLTIAAQTARGLKALHEATIDDRVLGAIHRDMKPANILLAPQGQAKITDYGITRVAADFYQTMAGDSVRGSPLYMSPEQARGEDLTQASDVFSFGLVVLEMITGEPVFLAGSLDAIVQRVREADVGPALASGRRRLPELTAFVEGCLAPRPGARFADGAALLEAIREMQPPAFGDERVAKVAAEGARILQEYEDKRRSVPVRKYWSRLPGGEDGSNLGDLETRDAVDGDATGPGKASGVNGPGEARANRLGPETGAVIPSDEANTGETSRRRNRKIFLTMHRKRAWWLWPVASLVGLVLGVLVVLLLVGVIRWIGARGDPGERWEDREPEMPAGGVGSGGVASSTVDGAGGIEVDDAPAADENGAGDGTGATDEGTADGEGTGEEGDGEGASDDGGEDRKDRDRRRSSRRDSPSLKLVHSGPSRAIRGDAVSLTVSVSPSDSYPASVWYRCAPDGGWKRRRSEGGADGTLQLTIPAGDWQVAGCSQVDYFVEVEGASGLERVGSTIKPLAYRLY